MKTVIKLTFYMEQNCSADFELLLVDQNVELAGVDACVRLLHGGDQQFAIVPVKRAPCVWL